MNVWHKVMTPQDGSVWITGASSGIGRETALLLARQGWQVHATARRAGALETLAAEVAGGPGSIHPQPGDVTDPEAMRRIVARITQGGPLALAILNAGVYLPMRARGFRAGDAAKTFSVNLTGVANGLDPVLEHMVARRHGHVALIASVAGYRGLPNAAAYSASKAGLIAMAEALAMDLADLGVRISVVNPGFVETPATAVNRFAMPMLMQPAEAAERLVRGLSRPGFEIRFPRRFALALRLIGLLPNRAYIHVVRRATGWRGDDATLD